MSTAAVKPSPPSALRVTLRLTAISVVLSVLVTAVVTAVRRLQARTAPEVPKYMD